MQESDFFCLLEQVFGRALGKTLIEDQRLPHLHNYTAKEALAQGYEPRVVWNILCDHMEIEDRDRWGKDNLAPPLIHAIT